MNLSKPNYLLKALSSNTTTLGIQASACEFQGTQFRPSQLRLGLQCSCCSAREGQLESSRSWRSHGAWLLGAAQGGLGGGAESSEGTLTHQQARVSSELLLQPVTAFTPTPPHHPPQGTQLLLCSSANPQHKQHKMLLLDTIMK